MRLEIRSRHIVITPELRAHCERRIHFALSRFGSSVVKVVARFSDVNGPRGGRDKRCLLEISLRQGAPVLIDSTASDLPACLDWAADRAGQAIGRELERTRATARASRRLSISVPAQEVFS
jgi:ribosome-associated translation inhibitor RaiA